jgi:hypothetical protein
LFARPAGPAVAAKPLQHAGTGIAARRLFAVYARLAGGSGRSGRIDRASVAYGDVRAREGKLAST